MPQHFTTLFTVAKPVIGMIHVAALPGTPKHSLTPEQIIDKAIHEANLFKDAGIDGLMIENMHDLPYLKGQVGEEVVAMMGVIAREVRKTTDLPTGVQILAGANTASISVAHAGGCQWVRVEGFVYGHVADEGWIDASAGELLRFRKAIGAEDILVFTDIKKKHSAHAVTADVSLVETAKAAAFFLSDGLIITGTATGEAADLDELKAMQAATNLPVLVGSGVTLNNVESIYPLVDGMIIGSWFKTEGHWANDVEAARVADFMEKVKALRLA